MFQPVSISLLVLILMSITSVRPTHAQEVTIEGKPGNRYVTTTASSEIKVAPDQVIVVLGVSNSDKVLRTAYAENAKRTKAVLSMLERRHIEAKDVQTTDFSVEPTYPDQHIQRQVVKPIGYAVHQQIVFTMHELDKVPTILADAFDEGANSVENIRVSVASVRALKDETRGRALKVAEEKATDMAAKLRSKLGKAVVIKDLGSNMEDNEYARARCHAMYNDTYAGMQVADYTGSFAPGSIKVVSLVSVTFELLD